VLRSRRTRHLAPVVAVLALALFGQAAEAQKKGRAKRLTSGASQRTEADELAEEEARKAAEERASRVPTVVEEKKREKVEVQDKPALKFEDYGRRTIELQVASKRKELIDLLDQVLSQDPPDEEKPELLFQKAELYQEEAQFHFFEGMQYDDAITRAEVEDKPGAEIKKLQTAKKSELKLSEQWQDDAVLIYREIEESYPKFERMPEVLYALGRALWDRQEYDESLRIYRKIIKEHPDSQYVADSWLAFGEYFFEVADEDTRDLNKALDAYQNAAKFEDNPIFGYAVYKQGWCWYNLGEHDKSADRFKEVVLYSQLNSDLLGERRIGLAREARRDYVLAYSHYGSAKKANAEFEVIASDINDRRVMLERLGDIFYGDGKDRDAIVIYRLLMKQDPENTRNPLFQGKVVKLASRIGQKRQVVAQARVLVDEYKRVRGIFKGLKEGDKDFGRVREDLAAADDVSDNTLRFLATTWHNEAKKTRDDDTFYNAYELYGDYLELFPDRKEAYEIRFFYAELLFKLEKFEQAGEQYVKVFQQKPEGKWAEPAAEEAVRAYDEVVRDFDRANKKKPLSGPDALKPRPLPEIKKKYIGACNNYVKHYPNGGVAVEAKYKVARTLYDYNYFDESTPRFMEIVETHSDSPRAEQSANLVLDSYNIVEDWQQLHDAARRFARNRTLMKNDSFRELIDGLLPEAAFKLISNYERRKEYEEAAKRYLAFTDEFEKHELADKGLANAAAMFTRAGQLDRAIKVRIKLVEEYPKSSLVADQIYAVATSYEQVVAYNKAAEWNERFVEAYPKDPRSKDALFNASIYRQGVGQTDKAIDNRKKYLANKEYAQGPDAVKIAFSIPVAWEQARKWDNATDEYLEFAKEWRKRDQAKALVAQYRAVRLLEKNATKKRAKKPDIKRYEKELANLRGLAKAYLKSGNPPEDAGEALGYLAFTAAEGAYEDFKKFQIEPPDNPKAFRKTLTEKREAKDKVLEAYKKVVTFKDPEWAVASLYMIGVAQVHLVDAIQKVPAPKGLTEDQEQLFKDKLSEQTLPIEEGATETMVLCLDESARFGVFNDWTRKCLSFLEERRPDTYPKNDLEVRAPIVVDARPAEHGQGLVLTLPKRGAPAEPDPDSEPPLALRKDEKLEVKKKEPPKPEPEPEGGDDFNFEEGALEGAD
jgi:TolA-binding protein